MRDDLPSGTVTFLFTDVEGSTSLLHSLGAERYAGALAEHRLLIRDACSAEGGVEVDTQGDAFFFAFPTAPGALAAAASFTDALSRGPIQVRVGIHTGRPHLTDEGYVGDDVHFAARVAASGHGGQVVLSAATADLVDCVLLVLGEHRLKDITEPVPLYQLGEGGFPPLKTISNTNLPRPASSFVGRERELEEVLARIQDGARLLTLTGPGGSGKTRLAIEAGTTLVPQYKAGVFWVGLSSLRDPAFVSDTIAQTLGAKDGVAEHVGDRELLLLLDNLEQVVEAAPELASLLEACPNLTLLVTSRELLRVRGEVEYPVPPLASPEAVALFCERAQLEPSEEIAELCARLDNLPLAVELAAARTRALTVSQILERLSGRLDLLKGGRDADPRQQTLRATIEWSYDLLSEEEQRLFAALSVFAGGCTLEAAEEVCDADLDTLQSLVEKSLLRFTPSDTGGRYWMLETIREYAEQMLVLASQDGTYRKRHLEYVLELVARVEATFATDATRGTFAAELDNFRAALSWSASAGLSDAELDLIGRSWPFWWYRGRPSEGLAWAESALARSADNRDGRRAKALTAAAMFAYRSGDYEATRWYAEQSLRIAGELGELDGTVWPLLMLGNCASDTGELEKARDHFEQALRRARQTGERRLVGITMNNLGVLAERERDFDRALALYRDALDIAKSLGDLDEAPLETLNLASCLVDVGRTEEAARVGKEGLVLAHEVGNTSVLAFGFCVLAAVAERKGATGAGARLLGFAELISDQLGEVRASAEADFFERTAAALQEALGGERFRAEVASARSLGLEDAIDYALSCLD